MAELDRLTLRIDADASELDAAFKKRAELATGLMAFQDRGAVAALKPSEKYEKEIEDAFKIAEAAIVGFVVAVASRAGPRAAAAAGAAATAAVSWAKRKSEEAIGARAEERAQLEKQPQWLNQRIGEIDSQRKDIDEILGRKGRERPSAWAKKLLEDHARELEEERADLVEKLENLESRAVIPVLRAKPSLNMRFDDLLKDLTEPSDPTGLDSNRSIDTDIAPDPKNINFIESTQSWSSAGSHSLMRPDANEMQARGRQWLERGIESMKDELRILRAGSGERETLARRIDMERVARDHDIDSIDAQIAKMQELSEAIRAQEQINRVADTIADSFGNAFEDVVLGTKSVEDAVNDMAREVQATLLRELVTNPLKDFLSDSLRGMLGMGGGGGFFAELFHSGGVVGAGGRIPLPAFHGGGRANLPRLTRAVQPDEMLGLLRKGETVRTREQEAALGGGQRAITFNVNLSPPNGMSSRDARLTGKHIASQAARSLAELQARGSA
jgi:hypothetical protein